MIIKLIMLRIYFLLPTLLLVLNCLVAQEKPNPLEGIDLRTISMHYDWANFARYEEKNKEVLIDQNNDRVVFMGNSITEGWKNKMPAMFDNQTFINRGISGQTTPQMLLRFRTDVIELKPKAVVILAGTNDIAGNTPLRDLEAVVGNLASMGELAKHQNIKVILCSVLPASDYPWRPGKNPDTKIPLLNELIRNYAEKEDFYYLDYFTSMTDGNNGLKANYGSDGVHPNIRGYRVMQKMVLKAIDKIL